MKILLDECCPRALGKVLLGHDVLTVAMMGWNSYTNGELINDLPPEKRTPV